MVVELQRDPGDDPQQDFEDGSKKFILCQPGETKGGEGGGCGDEERKGRECPPQELRLFTSLTFSSN